MRSGIEIDWKYIMRKDITDIKREPTPSKARQDFELFQKEFKKWQDKFGLTGYRVYFKYEPIDSAFADIKINQGEMVVTTRLNSKLPDKDKPHRDIRHSAKHEAIHLLIGRLEQNARWRYSSEAEIYEATEELVFRLEGLITD